MASLVCRIVLPPKVLLQVPAARQTRQLPSNGGSCLDLNEARMGGFPAGSLKGEGGIDGSCQQALLARPDHPSQMPSIGTLWSDLRNLGYFSLFGMELMGLNQCPKGSTLAGTQIRNRRS